MGLESFLLTLRGLEARKYLLTDGSLLGATRDAVWYYTRDNERENNRTERKSIGKECKTPPAKKELDHESSRGSTQYHGSSSKGPDSKPKPGFEASTSAAKKAQVARKTATPHFLAPIARPSPTLPQLVAVSKRVTSRPSPPTSPMLRNVFALKVAKNQNGTYGTYRT